MTRFNHNADDVSIVADYFRNRAFQLLADGYRWSGVCTPIMSKGVIWGLMTQYHTNDNMPHHSIYVLASHRGKGHLSRCLKYLKQRHAMFVTVDECNVYDFLIKYVNVVRVGDHLTWSAYKKIETFYGDNQSRRSKLFWMNHIDEGIAILRKLGANTTTQAAFMLHPLVQRDEDFKLNYANLDPSSDYGNALMLALEYRNIANQFLSPMEHHPGYDDHNLIALSPLDEVNQMLIADKIQNYKDFHTHHLCTHPRAKWLDTYFKQWFKRLNIDNVQYIMLESMITIQDPIILNAIEM